MFEHRLIIAQLVLVVAGLFAVTATVCFMTGSMIAGIVFVVFEHAIAAIGCAFLADSRGYPGLIGFSFGIGLGIMGSLILMNLPDESQEDEMAKKIALASEGVKNARQRDRGYEILEDD